jgi:hypothetical protein
MTLDKLTPILIVEHLESALKPWLKLGYAVTTRVPDEGPPAFVILNGKRGELMLQTRASLVDDLPAVAKRKPKQLLYADVASLTSAKKAFSDAEVLIPRRKTFYGATEAWLELADGTILGLAEHG